MSAGIEQFRIYGKMQDEDKIRLVEFLKENLEEPEYADFDGCENNWFEVCITDTYDRYADDILKNVVAFLNQNNLNVVLRSDLDSYFESARCYGLVTRIGEQQIDIEKFICAEQNELQRQMDAAADESASPAP